MLSKEISKIKSETGNLIKHDNLLRVFEDIHNHIYANDGLSPEQSLDEVIKILFLKIFDEKSKNLRFKIFLEEYEDIINERTNQSFLNRIKDLQKETFNFFSVLFEKKETVKLKNSTLGFVVNKIQNIDLLNSSNDIKGLAFQKFIHSSQRVGRGQFFTPEQVVELCIKILQPKSYETIMDPACGSGSFLSSALKYVSLYEPGKAEQFAKEKIFGIEINRTAARIAKMRMILDGDGFSNILQYDALSDFSEIELKLNNIGSPKNNTYKNFFDIIVTNPPFGTQGKISSNSILRNFDLGYKWEKEGDSFTKTKVKLNGQVPDILFIERCLQLLKPGGRMAIVLPNGDFENSSIAYVRYYISTIAEVLAIIKLPQETFIPSGTGVKTSILFLRKKDGKDKVKKIFFSQVTKLGYLGNKNGSLVYKKDSFGNVVKDANGSPKVDEDISLVVKSYLNFQKNNTIDEKENSFLLNKENLLYSRLDFGFYEPSYRMLIDKLSSKGACKLGDLVKIEKSKSNKLKQKESEVSYVELSDVSSQYNEIINANKTIVHELPSRASYEIQEGQLITAVAGNSIGTENHVSAIVTKEYNGSICTNGFRVFSVKKSLVNPYYLLYYFKSKIFLDQVYRYRTGAAIPSILDADLLNILILLPPMKEQDRIGNVIKEGFEQRKEFRYKIKELEISNSL